MAYTKQVWNVGKNGGTPIRASWLNHMETGIKNAHDRIDDIVEADGASMADNVSLDGTGTNYLSGSTTAQEGFVDIDTAVAYIEDAVNAGQVAVTNVTASGTVALTATTAFKQVTCSGHTTFTLPTFTKAGMTMWVRVAASSGTKNLTWPGSVTWINDAVTSVTATQKLVLLRSDDSGTSWYAVDLGVNSGTTISDASDVPYDTSGYVGGPALDPNVGAVLDYIPTALSSVFSYAGSTAASEGEDGHHMKDWLATAQQQVTSGDVTINLDNLSFIKFFDCGVGNIEFVMPDQSGGESFGFLMVVFATEAAGARNLTWTSDVPVIWQGPELATLEYSGGEAIPLLFYTVGGIGQWMAIQINRTAACCVQWQDVTAGTSLHLPHESLSKITMTDDLTMAFQPNPTDSPVLQGVMILETDGGTYNFSITNAVWVGPSLTQVFSGAQYRVTYETIDSGATVWCTYTTND